jgi:hypothetical protein
MARGMYGVKITGLRDYESLGTVPSTWNEWSVTVDDLDESEDDRHQFADADRGLLRFGDGSTADVTRMGDGGSVHLRLARRVDENLLAHPYLGAVGMFSALWGGRIPFHAGAVDIGGQAWLILATKGGGKSTTLALFDRLGYDVLSDDLAIIDTDFNVHRGPRFIDLREDSAEELGIGTCLGVLGARERWRHPIGDAPLTLPLGGIIKAEWGEHAIEKVAGTEKVWALAGSIALSVPAPWNDLFMDVVTSTPLLRWSRPHQLSEATANIDSLIAAVTRR